MPIVIDSQFDVYAMIGNPVIQTKTPQIFNEYCTENAIKAVMVPMLIRDNDELISFLDFVKRTDAIKGFVATIPHKSDMLELIADHTETASRLNAINTVRKSSNGELHGAMFDGAGFMHALRKKNFSAKGKQAIIIGSGAAGRAIALELLMDGISDLMMVDPNPQGHQIFESIASSFNTPVNTLATCPELSNYQLVINASPIGMQPDDPLPGPIDNLNPNVMVADAVTNGKSTRFLSLAKKRGCLTQTGQEMAAGHFECILEFFEIQSAK